MTPPSVPIIVYLCHLDGSSISSLQEPVVKEVQEPLTLGCLRLGALPRHVFRGREERGLMPNGGNGVRHKCDPNFRANWEGRRALESRFLVGMMPLKKRNICREPR